MNEREPNLPEWVVYERGDKTAIRLSSEPQPKGWRYAGPASPVEIERAKLGPAILDVPLAQSGSLEYQGDSLQDFVAWAQLILEKHPDAKVWTYETQNVSADYEEDNNRVTISGLL